MKISVGKPRPDDTFINVHFGRRAGFHLDDVEAGKLKGQLAAYLAGEFHDGQDDEVYVIYGDSAEDHLQIVLGDAWFEITTDEASELVEKLTDFV